jgi:hypothetical protein
MPNMLNALAAFVAEHQRCGDLDGGVDNGFAWLPPGDGPGTLVVAGTGNLGVLALRVRLEAESPPARIGQQQFGHGFLVTVGAAAVGAQRQVGLQAAIRF